MDSGIYENNWKYSDLRTFANVTFYDDAFSSEEKSTIWTKTVDNSLLSTAYTENP
ncbi:MAG: hypothetical protein HUJ60_02885, partial [Bacilli bacterium]|nr:hypothetical protein [Bacilli bacterium]